MQMNLKRVGRFFFIRIRKQVTRSGFIQPISNLHELKQLSCWLLPRKPRGNVYQEPHSNEEEWRGFRGINKRVFVADLTEWSRCWSWPLCWGLLLATPRNPSRRGRLLSSTARRMSRATWCSRRWNTESISKGRSRIWNRDDTVSIFTPKEISPTVVIPLGDISTLIM